MINVKPSIIKGPVSDASKLLTIDGDDGDEVMEEVGTLLQPNLIDPKLGTCFGALRSWDDISKIMTQ